LNEIEQNVGHPLWYRRATVAPSPNGHFGNAKRPTEALTLGEKALANHNKVPRPDHSWTRDSARVTAHALDALGRTEEAKALRERYGLAAVQKLSGSEDDAD
jgi:hypothetical protein